MLPQRVLQDDVIENGLPQEILLNVNVPFLPADKIRGISLTRQGLRVYHSRLDEGTDPRGRSYYWIAGDAPTGVPERGTDVGALAEGYVSVTPLQLDLTAYRALTDLNSWQMDSELGSLLQSTFMFSDRPSDVKPKE